MTANKSAQAAWLAAQNAWVAAQDARLAAEGMPRQRTRRATPGPPAQPNADPLHHASGLGTGNC